MKKINLKNTLCRIGIALLIMVVSQGLFALENGLARTPPMGWSTWNIFASSIDETKIKQIADAMVSSGMKDAGYIYVNIDDTWMKAGRDENGNLVADPVKFPGGMKALADYIHSLGLKLGIYGDRGTATCCGILESGSQGHEYADANTWASWGVDYLKHDSCNATLDLKTQYELMRDALAQSGRPIAYSICCWYFVDTWMLDAGNLWRTTSDISDNFSSILSIADVNEKLYMHAGPGHWNDPDMLEVGNGGCTFEEYKAHFSLWCIMAAPLIAGNDLRTMTAETKTILLNTEAIAVDQDPAGIQGHIIRDGGDLELWMKPLGSATGSVKAVVLLNRSASAANISVSWSEIGLAVGSASVRDLWAHTELGSFSNSYSTSVPAHGCVMLKIIGTGTGTSTPVPSTTSTSTLTRTATSTATQAATATRTSTAAVTRTPTATRTATTRTATPTRTATSNVTRTPASTSATATRTTTSTAVITRTPTAGTPTPAGTGCTCDSGCSTITVITPNFSKDGSGAFCYEAVSLGSYINSWNLASLKVNGVDFTNKWVSTAGLPAQIGGKYYVFYNSTVTYGHFEAMN